jgi:futalosine hydrolase
MTYEKIFAKVIYSGECGMRGTDGVYFPGFADICSMHILVTAATPFEIMDSAGFFQKNGFKAGDHTIKIAITGVGLVAATYSLMHEIGKQRPGLVIQAGIAGCFTEKKPGETVVIKKEALADLGVYEQNRFKSIFELRLADPDASPYSGGYLPNPYEGLLSLSSLEAVTGISINEVTTDKIRMEWYQQNFSPVVESMEGAALHYVCLQEKIPFLQLRTVSNKVGERDKTKWDIKKAIENLNQELISFINKLSEQDAKTYFGIQSLPQ